MTAPPSDRAPALLAPTDAAEVCAAVRSAARLVPLGARTKPGLTPASGPFDLLDLTGLRGIVDYDPAELTFTARAGAPLAEVTAALAEHRQFLPFDPPLVARGATLGGAVASGIAGSGRQRYGGVRDFVIGVTLVDGEGTLVRGGGKVVKNAAGFDLPKLMAGSLGTLGALVELTLKVFPLPEAHLTLRFVTTDFAAAHRLAQRLAGAPFDLDALDLEPAPGRGWQALIRLGGPADSLAGRASRIQRFLGAGADPVEGERDAALWDAVRELAWAPAGAAVLRVPAPPSAAPALEAELQALDAAAGDGVAARRWSAGGGVLWLAWPGARPLAGLRRVLDARRLAAQALTGDLPGALLGQVPGAAFSRRIKAALDPSGRFPDLGDLQVPGAAP
jgi:glycolate oxidase FAD binding subunit